MRIGINADYFQEWGGGIDFLQLILRGFNSIQKETELEIVILVPFHKSSISVLLLTQIKSFIKKNLKRKGGERKILDPKILQESFKVEGINKWIIYDSDQKTLAQIAIEEKVDVVLPCYKSLGKDFPLPWVGYVFDFQHKYIPELFSQKDIQNRNKLFENNLNDAPTVIVNALEVKSDVHQFIPNAGATVFALPFCPLYDLQDYPKGEFSIPEIMEGNYFLVSNQFWKHKDHETAFRAMAIFMEDESLNNIKLVCTGEFSDYRDNYYAQYLTNLIKNLDIQNRLILTGYISKRKQKALMHNAIALIQPTLFEGGPGGGSVYEAIGMGLPVILSDISINREIDHENTLYFNRKDPQDLAMKMIQALALKKISKEELLIKKEIFEAKLGQVLLESIKNATAGFKKNAPLISIVLVTLQAESLLRRCLRSIRQQTYPNIELIVVDGGSKDATLEILKENNDIIKKWISEPDLGIYDAMNKGVKMASGDFLYFLGYDDELYNVFHLIARQIAEPNTIYYGNVRFRNSGVTYDGPFNAMKLVVQNICHQAIFYPRSALLSNPFQLEFHLLSDYYLNLQLYSNKLFRFKYLDEEICIYNEKGRSGIQLDQDFIKQKLKMIRLHYSFYVYLYALLRKLIAKYILKKSYYQN